MKHYWWSTCLVSPLASKYEISACKCKHPNIQQHNDACKNSEIRWSHVCSFTSLQTAYKNGSSLVTNECLPLQLGWLHCVAAVKASHFWEKNGASQRLNSGPFRLNVDGKLKACMQHSFILGTLILRVVLDFPLQHLRKGKSHLAPVGSNETRSEHDTPLPTGAG